MELREGVSMKKIILGIIIGVLLSTTAFAATLTVNTVSYKVFVDGKEVTSEKINYNGRTYLEMRQVAELLGAKVEWDGKKADVYSKDYTPPLPDMGIKEVDVYIDGNKLEKDQPFRKFSVNVKNGELFVCHWVLEFIPNGNFSMNGDELIFRYGPIMWFIRNQSGYFVNGTKIEYPAVNFYNEEITSWYLPTKPITDTTGIKFKLENNILTVTTK